MLEGPLEALIKQLLGRKCDLDWTVIIGLWFLCMYYPMGDTQNACVPEHVCLRMSVV